MQARENRIRPTHRGWPPGHPALHPSQGGATNSSIQQHSTQWPHPMRGSTAPPTTGAPVDAAYLKAARYEPYHHRPARQQAFEFTIQDLDRCLFGKQDMRVVQINDKSTNHLNSATGAEDKNKPAKWCDLCQEIRFGECPEHGPLTSLRDPMALSGPKSYAISTFPDEVGLCISTLPLAGYGVFARHFIPVGTWIGPYEGKKISVEEGMKLCKQSDASFLWEVYDNSRLAHFLDASDENNSSWMRFIQCARHRGEQNLFVFQYHGSIYYRAFKNILVGEELLVWYDEKYPQYLGIPYELSDLSSRSNETGQPSEESAKAQVEFERRHVENSHPPYHHYHHTSIGSQFIHGASGKTISSEKHTDPSSKPQTPHQKHENHPTNSKAYQGAPTQPPALSQAPTIPGDARSHHSSIYVTAGKSQSSSHPHSPRPGSVNTTVFRREHLTSSSSMLRSMSEDDLRHKRKDRPPTSHHTQSYEKEHGEHDRIPHTVDHMNLHGPPPGLLVHPGMVPPSHFSPATSYTRLPPVMSISPLDPSKAKHHELNKLHYRERPPVDRVREHERMLHMHERIHPEFTEKVRKNQGSSHDMSLETWHNGYRCKMCGKSFSHKHAFDTHNCEGQLRDGLHCNKCQISFGDHRDFHEHMMGHRDSGAEVPSFWCSICSRSFSNGNSLRNHMKVHEKPTVEHVIKDAGINNRPECGKCGKRFHKQSDLTKHTDSPDECVS